MARPAAARPDAQGPNQGPIPGPIPAPDPSGSVELADGRWVKGFICETAGLAGALDITEHGGWRRYLEAAGAG